MNPFRMGKTLMATSESGCSPSPEAAADPRRVQSECRHLEGIRRDAERLLHRPMPKRQHNIEGDPMSEHNYGTGTATKLVRYEQARTALADAHRVDEVKDHSRQGRRSRPTRDRRKTTT